MKIFAKQLLTASGWLTNQLITITDGVITQIEAGQAAQAERQKGIIIPGMVNCHSHAFQRAFAGFSEQGSEGKDSFWTWRSIMYQFLAQIDEKDAQLIATQLYIEMLKMGYTRVAEFHYLHHNFDGYPYPKLATMAQAIFKASDDAGIGLTLLPVLYQYSGFGQQAPNKGQARFINSTAQFNQLVTDCVELSYQYTNSNVGIAPHSLRATDKDAIECAVNHVRTLDANAPVHIHIAEQQQEVNDCLAHYQQRPVQWLLDNLEVDKHWCLIHATHITPEECTLMSEKNVVAGICPTTEANLGDGIFPTAEFLQQRGVLAIGSDSHISVNPIEELRLLEYAQRLIKQQRAVLASAQQPSVGQNLWLQAIQGGAQACGRENLGDIAVGKQADLLVLDDAKLALFAQGEKYRLDSAIFASHTNIVKDVMVNGCWVVDNYHHKLEQPTQQAFSELLTKLSTKLNNA